MSYFHTIKTSNQIHYLLSSKVYSPSFCQHCCWTTSSSVWWTYCLSEECLGFESHLIVA